MSMSTHKNCFLLNLLKMQTYHLQTGQISMNLWPYSDRIKEVVKRKKMEAKEEMGLVSDRFFQISCQLLVTCCSFVSKSGSNLGGSKPSLFPAYLWKQALRALRSTPITKRDRPGMCRQTRKRKSSTDGEADRQGVYSPLSSLINIWSVALWWILIRTLIHSLLIPTDCDHCLDVRAYSCYLWMWNQNERLKA